jgi:hypothetical protein
VPIDNDVLSDIFEQTFEQEKFSSEYDLSGSIGYDIIGDTTVEASIGRNGSIYWVSDKNTKTNYLAQRRTQISALPLSVNNYYNIGDFMLEMGSDLAEEPEIFYLENEISPNYLIENYVSKQIIKAVLSNENTFGKKTLFGSKYKLSSKYIFSAKILDQLFSISDFELLSSIVSETLSVDVYIYLIIKNEKMLEYGYDIQYDFGDVSLSLIFEQTFTDLDQDNIIAPDNSYIHYNHEGDTQISVLIDKISDILTNNSYGYDFELRSEVDEGILSPSVGLFLRGTNMHSSIKDVIYFNNYYELDSDYKPELTDVKKYRVKLNNEEQEVWDEIIIALWPNELNLIDEYNSQIEESFMLIDLLDVLGNIDFVIVDTNEDVDEFTIPIKIPLMETILNLFENMIDFNIYDVDSNLAFQTIECVISATKLDESTSLIIITEGTYIDSENITQTFNLEYKIDFIIFELGNEYSPPTDKADIS